MPPTKIRKEQYNPKYVIFLPSTTLDLTLATGVSSVMKLFDGFTTGYNVAVPRAGRLQNLYFRTSSTQPVTGTLTCTVGTDPGASTIVATVPAGAALGVFSDTTHYLDIAAGTVVYFTVKNNAGVASAAIVSAIVELYCTAD